MSRDTFTRLLAIAAIVIALTFSFLRMPGGAGQRNGLLGRMVRWLVFCAVEEEFRDTQPHYADPGVLLQENSRPQRPIGNDGTPEIDHGRGW